MSAPIAILSPHLDDAVLSCWHVLAGPGDVMVVNVFAGVPPADTPCGWWDSLSGHRDPRSTVIARRAEDRAALALAAREPLNLEFLDCQYRSGDPPPQPLVSALLDALPASATVYAPAALGAQHYDPGRADGGAGPHPDHLAVRGAALELRARGFSVSLYADLPHASARGWPAWIANDAQARSNDSVSRLWEDALAQTGIAPEQRMPAVCRLSAEELARKVEAVRRYASQVPVLELAFQRLLEDPALLGYEVVWALRAELPTPAP